MVDKTEIIEELAANVVLAQASDAQSIGELVDLLRDLERAVGAPATDPVGGLIDGCLELLSNLGQLTPEQGSRALASVASSIGELQRLLTLPPGTNEAPSGPEPAPGTLVLPEGVDEGIFRDFLAGAQHVLVDLERDMLGIEQGTDDSLGNLKRRLHTLKGDSGLLGLNEIEEFCHAVEDLLETPDLAVTRVDSLLAAKDWIGTALESASRFRTPAPPPEDLLAQLRGEQAPDSVNPAPRPDPAPSPDPALAAVPENLPSDSTPPDWDEEIIALVEEFVQESQDGLGHIDEVLLQIDDGNANPDQINGIFRVFHTIKGNAGFLEFHDLTTVAHASETLLNRVRDGETQLVGTTLDLIFDSAAQLRILVDVLKRAVESGRGLTTPPEVAPLLERLERAAAGKPTQPAELPRAAARSPLGEILINNGVASPEQVGRALDTQKESGRRLGEELVAQESVAPKQVAQALRAQQKASERHSTKLKETLKVDLEKVDSLVEMIGELVIVESMVVHAPEIAGQASPRLRNYLSQLGKITRDLQDVGLGMRMVPVRGVFQKMARMVRDLSRKESKKIRTVVFGEGTEMDRSMVEAIADPLVHMIRNAVDHGMDTEEERGQAGKTEPGAITLSAYHQGGSIVIEVSDNGRGLNRAAIVAKAVERGVIGSEDTLTDQEIDNLIFAPGFSTAAQVTEISGRGVGMDVVRRNIEKMRGRVTICSTPGAGSTFKIVLPLTLAIIDGMIVSCGAERYIIPTLSIIESVRPTAATMFSYVGDKALVTIRGETLPLLRLDSLFEIPDARPDPTTAQVVVLETTGGKIGLLVDEVLSQQQVVIKSLDHDHASQTFLAGAAILSNGRVGLILNVDEIRSLADDLYRGARPSSLSSHDKRIPMAS